MAGDSSGYAVSSETGCGCGMGASLSTGGSSVVSGDGCSLGGSVSTVSSWRPFKSFPSAFLGRVRILPLGVVAGKLGDLRTSGGVRAARDCGFIPPWVSGVPVKLGNGTYPGRVLSGGRAAGDGRTRASTFDEAARTLVVRVPKARPLGVKDDLVTSLWWQGLEKAIRVEVVVSVLYIFRGSVGENGL